MSNEIQTVQQTNAVAVTEDYKAIAMEWLTSTGNLQKFSDNEQSQFIDMCSAFGLNPIKREIYGIKYGSNFNLIVGYETYIKRAERSGKLSGWRAWVEGSGNNLVAKIEIHRKDWQFPFCHEVYFEEYKQNTALWQSKPRTMIRKVVIAQGFRMCFSDDIGGMPYTADELPPEKIGTYEVAKTKPLPAEEKSEKPAIDYSAEMNKIISTTYDGKVPVFSNEELASYRINYRNLGPAKTLEKMKVELDARMKAYEAAEQE